MTWTLPRKTFCTLGKVKNDTSLPRRRFCWLNGVGGQSWRIFIFRGWNLIFFTGAKTKSALYYRAKNTINPK